MLIYFEHHLKGRSFYVEKVLFVITLKHTARLVVTNITQSDLFTLVVRMPHTKQGLKRETKTLTLLDVFKREDKDAKRERRNTEEIV